jgi:hypothetical protein
MRRSVDFGQIDQIPGHLTQEAIIVWNFLLTNQTTLGIRGGFLEIGVWEGKSATLGTMHLLDDEPSILIDINPCDAALARVRKLKPAGVCFLQLRSTLAANDPRLLSYTHKIRFVHIDGEHDAATVSNDLALARSVICEGGIICVDDFFNPVYPQVTAAIHLFLFQQRFNFQMLMCGANKCWIVSAASYPMYSELIHDKFLQHARRYDLKASLHKSTYTHGMGCFSLWSKSDREQFGISFTDQDRRLVGLDADPGMIPF